MSKGDDSEDPIEIVLLDIKTGKSGLNGEQKKIGAATAAKKISFDVLRINERAWVGMNRPSDLYKLGFSLGMSAREEFQGLLRNTLGNVRRFPELAAFGR